MKKYIFLALLAILLTSIGRVNAQVQLIFPYEAESATLSGSAIIKDATNASNAKVVSDFSALNASLRCDTINGGPYTGTSTLTIRYANGNTDNRSLSLSVNGTFVKQVSFAPTVDWNTFADVSVSVPLLPGKTNVVQLQRTATDVAGVDIDSYTITLKNPSSTDNFNLVWADEFNGSGVPDQTKWEYEDGYVRNKELQYYTRSTDNVRQYNGNLDITIKKESTPICDTKTNLCYNYSSGSVTTRNRSSWTYGKIEGRFKMPSSTSMWSCFWTLGVSESAVGVGWPKCGELDIFEHIDSETLIHSTAHWTNALGVDPHVGATYNVDVTQWHNYSVEWTPTAMKWYVDGVRLLNINITNGINNTFAFHLPHFILVNSPIGGDWPKVPDATTVLPATMSCQYIRVYEWVPPTTLPITYLALSPTVVSLPKGKYITIKTTIIPYNATNKALNWQSSDPSIATVDPSTGKVTGLSSGSVTITATATDGSNKSAICTVNVIDPYTYNFVSNPGFELLDNASVLKPSNWGKYPVSDSAKVIIGGTSHSGSNYATIGGKAPIAVTFLQAVNSIPNGIYNLKGWFRSTGGQPWAALNIKYFNKTDGTDLTYTPLNFAMNNWTQVSINNIHITTGTCQVEVYNQANANQSVDIDDIELMLAPPTALKDLSASKNISIYPSVITNNVLNISNTGLEKCDISITNVSGQLLYNNHFNSGNSLINVTFLKRGIYLVRVNSGSESYIQKIIMP